MRADKEKLILGAAEKLFQDRRYDQVTLDEVAARAGVGKGTIYRYFKDKEDLFARVILWGLDELVECLESPRGEAGVDPRQELRRAVASIIAALGQRRNLFALTHSGPVRHTSRRKKIWQSWHERTDRLTEALAAIIDRGIRSATYRPDVQALTGARLLLGMVRAALRHADEVPADTDLAELVLGVFERGIRQE